jgi:hypothetical protein
VDGIHVTFAGTKEMQRRLLGMAASVQGAVLKPVVAESAGVLKDLMVSLAPKRTGALGGGLIADLMKIGLGYCYYWVRLAAPVYYGVFQEFGLGTGRSIPVSERTRRRRSNYELSLLIRKKMIVEQGRSGAAWKAALATLGKREAKRQKYLAEGKYLQGERRPNMAAHPFMRPAVKFLRTELAVRMLEGAAANIVRWTGPGR